MKFFELHSCCSAAWDASRADFASLSSALSAADPREQDEVSAMRPPVVPDLIASIDSVPGRSQKHPVAPSSTYSRGDAVLRAVSAI